MVHIYKKRHVFCNDYSKLSISVFQKSACKFTNVCGGLEWGMIKFCYGLTNTMNLILTAISIPLMGFVFTNYYFLIECFLKEMIYKLQIPINVNDFTVLY